MSPSDWYNRGRQLPVPTVEAQLMEPLVLNQVSRQFSLERLLESAGQCGGALEIVNGEGDVVATLMLAPNPKTVQRAANLSEDEIADLRRRMKTPRDKDITTAELFERLRRLETVESTT